MTTLEDDPRARRRALALRALRTKAAAEQIPETVIAEGEAALRGAFLAADLAAALFGRVDDTGPR